jgi:hypothetical protein
MKLEPYENPSPGVVGRGVSCVELRRFELLTSAVRLHKAARFFLFVSLTSTTTYKNRKQQALGAGGHIGDKRVFIPG